jgi:hypothetical protein
VRTYRVEHRTADGSAVIIAWTDAADASQAELSEHAARLLELGATGELVLVATATGDEVARRYLWPADETSLDDASLHPNDQSRTGHESTHVYAPRVKSS